MMVQDVQTQVTSARDPAYNSDNRSVLAYQHLKRKMNETQP